MIKLHLNAQMAELVDALVSGTSIERCGGSSPLLGTMKTKSFVFNKLQSTPKSIVTNYSGTLCHQ